MKAIDRWREWHPPEDEKSGVPLEIAPSKPSKGGGLDDPLPPLSDEKYDARTETAPSKPSKVAIESQKNSFEGFEGAISGNPPIFSDAPELADLDPLDRLRQPFVNWFNQRIHLDAKALALHLPPRWSTTVAVLHRDLCRWMADRGQGAPPALPEFVSLLQELSCAFRTIAGEQFIDHVALRSDVEANAEFQRQPVPDPQEPAPDPTPEPSPVPATAIRTRPEGIEVPDGVRLIQWVPKPAPIQLSPSETVLDAQTFAAATLRQLGNHLRGRKFLDGGWGLQGLLDRLAAVGCEVEIEDECKASQ